MGNKEFLDRWTPTKSKRFSYASWTQPSHSCLLSGLLPYESIPGQLASKIYKDDLDFWCTALGTSKKTPSIEHLLPEFSLALLAHKSGWGTYGRVAMPVLNPATAFSRGFDDYELSPAGSSLGAQIESLSLFTNREKCFVFINAGDTHYPYLMPKGSMPRVSGIHGVASQLFINEHASYAVPFSPSELKELHMSQVKGFERSLIHLESLIDNMRKPLLLVLTSDHGELFGEDNYFGHGPFFHKLLFEVPLAIGVIK